MKNNSVGASYYSVLFWVLLVDRLNQFRYRSKFMIRIQKARSSHEKSVADAELKS